MSISLVYPEDYRITTAKYPDKYFDLAVCDIPYGIKVGEMAYLKEVSTTVRQKNGTLQSANRNKKIYTPKQWDSTPPDQTYFDELRRITVHQIIFGIEYVNWTGVGPGRIKWNKGVPDGMSFKSYELAYCSMIDHTVEIDLLWSGMRQAKSLSEPMVQQGNKKLNEPRIHPTQKPRLLYKRLYLDYGFPGMKVIDTHVGSGSSRIEADLFGCSEFIGSEIDTEHWNDQETRWKNYKDQFVINFPAVAV